MERGYFNNVPSEDAEEKRRLAPLAYRIISLMHIRAMYEPVADMKDAAFKSNQEKAQAPRGPAQAPRRLGVEVSRRRSGLMGT